MRLLKLVLVDAPLFVIWTWLKLYVFVLAAGSLILWAVLIWTLGRVAVGLPVQ